MGDKSARKTLESGKSPGNTEEYIYEKTPI